MTTYDVEYLVSVKLRVHTGVTQRIFIERPEVQEFDALNPYRAAVVHDNPEDPDDPIFVRYPDWAGDDGKVIDHIRSHNFQVTFKGAE